MFRFCVAKYTRGLFSEDLKIRGNQTFLNSSLDTFGEGCGLIHCSAAVLLGEGPLVAHWVGEGWNREYIWTACGIEISLLPFGNRNHDILVFPSVDSQMWP